LVINELVLRRGTPPDATYSFKHALLRDVAEESLLRSRSQQLHAQIASVLQGRSHEVAPERLALHYVKGGLGAQAVQYYIEAGKSALARSAYREALAHLNAGWAISATLPDGLDTKRQALALHSTRAEALTASQGYAGSETTDAYKSAYQLCDELGDSSEIFPLLRGLYNTCNSQGRLGAARDIATRCLEFARRQDDPAPLSLAYRLLGQNEFLMGEFQTAGEHLNCALDLYDEQAHADSARTYGLDLKSAPLKYVPLILWLQGYPDQALERLTENLIHGRNLGFAFNLALTRLWAYYLYMLRNEIGDAKETAIALDSLARQHEIPDCVIAAQAQLALAQCLDGSGDGKKITCAAERFSTYRATWGEFVVPFNLRTLATAYARHDQPDEALRVIDAALAVVDDTQERWSEAELWRIKGQIHLAISRCSNDEAKECFMKSLEIARRQRARSWELRTATSFARLLIEEGDVTGAHRLLGPIHEWFSEGFDTLDLKEAKALLDEMASSRR
jgi:tetratricopeptide (TPR) repeat protein